MNSYHLLAGAAYAVIHNSLRAVTLHKPQGSPALARHLPTHSWESKRKPRSSLGTRQKLCVKLCWQEKVVGLGKT